MGTPGRFSRLTPAVALFTLALAVPPGRSADAPAAFPRVAAVGRQAAQMSPA